MAKKLLVAECAAHTAAEWLDFAASRNVYYAPIGSFETRHHCLFNVLVLLAEGVGSSISSNFDEQPEGLSPSWSQRQQQQQQQTSLFQQSSVVPAVTSSWLKWGLEGRVFPVGEPVFFDVILEPLGNNWPGEDDQGYSSPAAKDPSDATLRDSTFIQSSTISGAKSSPFAVSRSWHHHDRFFVRIVADPKQWMLLGLAVELRTLSRWEDHHCRFAAVPLAPIPSTLNLKAGGAGGPHRSGDGGRVGLVDTPTVVVTRAVETTTSIKPGEQVPIDVVLCRAQLNVRVT
jgi:hypothetical protein